MPMYRMKPIVIEAVQIMPQNDGDVLDFLEKYDINFEIPNTTDEFYTLVIRTLDGDRKADQGDWLIHGVKGEIRICKPDIFEVTYALDELPPPPQTGG